MILANPTLSCPSLLVGVTRSRALFPPLTNEYGIDPGSRPWSRVLETDPVPTVRIGGKDGICAGAGAAATAAVAAAAA